MKRLARAVALQHSFKLLAICLRLSCRRHKCNQLKHFKVPLRSWIHHAGQGQHLVSFREFIEASTNVLGLHDRPLETPAGTIRR